MAQVAHAAALAGWLACIADRAAVKHKAVAEIRGMLRRENTAKLHFYFHRVTHIVDYAEAVGQSDAVCVHNGRAGDFKYIAEN